MCGLSWPLAGCGSTCALTPALQTTSSYSVVTVCVCVCHTQHTLLVHTHTLLVHITRARVGRVVLWDRQCGIAFVGHRWLGDTARKRHVERDAVLVDRWLLASPPQPDHAEVTAGHGQLLPSGRRTLAAHGCLIRAMSHQLRVRSTAAHPAPARMSTAPAHRPNSLTHTHTHTHTHMLKQTHRNLEKKPR